MTAAQYAGLGLKPGDLGDTIVYVLEDCLESVEVFDALATQWNTSFSGVTGLLYSSIPFIFKLRNIPRARQSGIFEDIRVMESAVIKMLSDDAKSKRKRNK